MGRGHLRRDVPRVRVHDAGLNGRLAPGGEPALAVAGDLAASAWEITTKFRVGKLPGVAAFVDDIPALCASQAFVPLSISMTHATRAGRLADEHRDPFDRMLIAQAQSEGMTLVTCDAAMAPFGTPLLWSSPVGSTWTHAACAWATR